MDPAHFDRPLVPAGYGLLIQEVAHGLGVGSELLTAAGLTAERLESTDGRLSPLQAGSLLFHAMELSGEPALGYELGLQSSLTSHGLVGLALMSVDSVRTAVQWGVEFGQLQLPMLAIHLVAEDPWAAVEVTATSWLGPVRQCMFDLYLVGLARMAPILSGRAMTVDDVELWFDYPEPTYYARYRDRLPTARFDMGANQVRFPARYLDSRPDTANPLTTHLLERRFRIEMAELGLTGDRVEQVRALLRSAPGLGLPDVAASLAVSPRTLKRQLSRHGVTYSSLTEEVRRAESVRLLRGTSATIDQIADRLGYADASSFVRAFRRWTGRTPGAYRRDGDQDPA